MDILMTQNVQMEHEEQKINTIDPVINKPTGPIQLVFQSK